MHSSWVASLLVLMAVSAQAQNPTSCMVGNGGAGSGGSPPASYSVTGATLPVGQVCLSYCTTCSTGDTACSAAQITNSVVIPAYVFLASADAATISGYGTQAGSGYCNVHTCTTADCNSVITCPSTCPAASMPSAAFSASSLSGLVGAAVAAAVML